MSEDGEKKSQRRGDSPSSSLLSARVIFHTRHPLKPGHHLSSAVTGAFEDRSSDDGSNFATRTTHATERTFSHKQPQKPDMRLRDRHPFPS